MLEVLASHYGESWWQEVLLLFVAMGNPSMFGPLMREVVKRPTFATQRELLGLLLEEAAERDPGPFLELLHRDQGRDLSLESRQLAAIEVLRQMGEWQSPKQMQMLMSPPLGLHAEVSLPVAAPDVTKKGKVELVSVPRGEFLMGSPPDEAGRFEDEGPQHRVKISPFWLGRYPVTNEQYGRFLAEHPHVRAPKYWGDRRFNQAHQPVVGVTWAHAREFASWAGGRLPTEAEWEYACRAGTTAARYGPDLDAIAWYYQNSGTVPQQVGQKKPNAWGLYDMLGNVWEWCSDRRRMYLRDNALVTNPVGPDSGTERAVRGGSWGDTARAIRAANRNSNDPTHTFGDVGFRLARD